MFKTLTFFLVLGSLSFLASTTVWAMEYRWFNSDDEIAIIDSDLEFLYSLKFSNNNLLHNEIFGGSDGHFYKRYLEDRIKIIRRSNTMANLYGFNDDGSRETIAVTSQFFQLPQLLRISVLIHEARHSEDDNKHWHHIDCPNPYVDENGNRMRSDFEGGVDLSGVGKACDADAHGAFGVTGVMLKHISERCENCNQKTRQQARALFEDMKKRIVNPVARGLLEND